VEGRVIVNNPDLAIRAVIDGPGIACTLEALADPTCARADWFACWKTHRRPSRASSSNYPGHRQIPAALRALIDMIRAVRGSGSSGSCLKNSFV
jgi:DNA-binding transcriptional LysR family regulator